MWNTKYLAQSHFDKSQPPNIWCSLFEKSETPNIWCNLTLIKLAKVKHQIFGAVSFWQKWNTKYLVPSLFDKSETPNIWCSLTLKKTRNTKYLVQSQKLTKANHQLPLESGDRPPSAGDDSSLLCRLHQTHRWVHLRSMLHIKRFFFYSLLGLLILRPGKSGERKITLMPVVVLCIIINISFVLSWLSWQVDWKPWVWSCQRSLCSWLVGWGRGSWSYSSQVIALITLLKSRGLLFGGCVQHCVSVSQWQLKTSECQ